MLKIAAGAFVVAVLLALAPGAAYAQPAPCAPGLLNTEDMAGVYIGMDGPMRVQIYPCGGTTLLWDNTYGRHLALYTVADRLPGGGVIASGSKPDAAVGYLDNAYTLGIKPAEPGFVQVITVDPYGQFVGFYRLKRV
jgi:hypothetical protein